MMDTLKKLNDVLTKREKIMVGYLLLAILAMAFSQAIGVASVMPFIGLVMDPDIVFENRWLYQAYESFNFTSVNRFIVISGVAMFLIILLSNAISAFATWFMLRFAWMNNHRLSTRLLDKYISMPYPFFLNQNSSNLSKNVLSEVNHLTQSYLIPMLTICTKGLIALFILIMLIWVNVLVSLVALLLLGGAYLAIYFRINKVLKEKGAERLQADVMRYKTVSESFGGIKEIKVTNRKHFFVSSYRKVSLKNAILMSWNAVIGEIPRFAMEAIAFGGIIIFILILLLTYQDASLVIPLASLFAFAGYRLMPALQAIFNSFTKMQFNKAVLDRIHSDIISDTLFDELPEISEEALPEPLGFKEEIKLENVTYNYPNTYYPVIKEVNLAIKKNSSVAFVGPTGVGKTTLVDIILGLLPPQKGMLLVDGVPVNEDNLLRWQMNIGYVPQHIYLSDNSVAHNIAFGIDDSKINHNSLEYAARVANIHDFIANELPDGYDTLIGERGIRLSGGQRQRIGIARALYHNPEVLVFDEATSALDGITEEAVLSAMKNAAKLKTLIIIAHRLTTVKQCDAIYILDKGRITSFGTYEYLLENNDQFRLMAKAAK